MAWMTIRNSSSKISELKAQAQSVVDKLTALEAMSASERADAADEEAAIAQLLQHMYRRPGAANDAPLAGWKQSEKLELADGTFIARRDYDAGVHTLA